MRYFFNLAGAVLDPDKEGVELDTLVDARKEAVRDLGVYIRDQPHLIWSGEELRMEVTDANRLILCTVIVFGIDAAASGSSSRPN